MAKVNDDYPKQDKPMSDADLKAAAIANYSAGPTTEASYDFPTEIIELPSKGKLYPKGHPLSSGTIEMKYMTAKEEDILTNQSYIKQGVVLDKLFQALIVTPVDYNDLLLGDKNAVLVAARVLGYGKDYEVTVTTPSGNTQTILVDLTKLSEKDIDWSLLEDGKNEFDFNLPASKRQVTLRILDQKTQKKVDAELKGLARLKRDANLTTLLKHVIIRVDGDDNNAGIRKFVDNELLAIDSRAIRNYLKTITPDVDMSMDVVDEETADPFRSSVTIGLDFFWPDAEL